MKTKIANISIRNTKMSELDEVMKIYKNAREFMASNNNPNQWWDYWPPRDLIEQDISEGVSYVCVDGQKIVGVFANLQGPDETYLNIEGGEWLNDEPYYVIHRIASTFESHGVLKAAVNFSLERCDNLRIDTFPPNKPMMNGLKKLGFNECGTIYVRGNEPRVAFHLVKDAV